MQNGAESDWLAAVRLVPQMLLVNLQSRSQHFGHFRTITVQKNASKERTMRTCWMQRTNAWLASFSSPQLRLLRLLCTRLGASHRPVRHMTPAEAVRQMQEGTWACSNAGASVLLPRSMIWSSAEYKRSWPPLQECLSDHSVCGRSR